jgi:hypothetical protein
VRTYYEVIGSAPVVLDGRSVLPGVITTAELDPPLEAFLVRLGAIRSVDPHVEPGMILPISRRAAQAAAAALVLPADPTVAADTAEE